MKLKVVVHEVEEGGYWAEIPALPGCLTEGDTLKELKKNAREAAQRWFDAVRVEPRKTRRTRIIEISV
jgi:predicted RNase H-like HicB family nuclease